MNLFINGCPPTALGPVYMEGGPQISEVTCGGSCRRDQIKMRDYMDRRVTPTKWVTSPTQGPPLPCKQVLNEVNIR